jgi:hypothetical protein
VHVTRFATIGCLGILSAACAGNPKPKTFGNAPDLTPMVEIVGNDRLPLHLRLDLPQSAHIAAFYVIPGQGTQMLYPADSTGSKPLPAGVQEVSTLFAVRPAIDSSRLLRRPQQRATPPGDQGMPQGGGQRRINGMEDAAFVLVYASKDPLTYQTLNDRVIGVSLPGYENEAFNTVTKLVRTAATGTGPWTAIAVPFRR